MSRVVLAVIISALVNGYCRHGLPIVAEAVRRTQNTRELKLERVRRRMRHVAALDKS